MNDIAAWLSAVGTVGAFFVSLWLLWIQIRENRKQRSYERTMTARHVSAWYDLQGGKSILWVQNISKEPVYYLVSYIGKAGTNFELPQEPENKYMEIVFGTVPPGAKFDQIVDTNFVTGEHFPDIPEVAVEFTDSAGIHWRRYANGEIKEILYRHPFD
ncbi:MAG: hypothetical protein NTX45_11080 [Proteobacteria bacterium]|nr:hypothetical protein [Pseudomonadota bacterium]